MDDTGAYNINRGNKPIRPEGPAQTRVGGVCQPSARQMGHALLKGRVSGWTRPAFPGPRLWLCSPKPPSCGAPGLPCYARASFLKSECNNKRGWGSECGQKRHGCIGGSALQGQVPMQGLSAPCLPWTCLTTLPAAPRGRQRALPLVRGQTKGPLGTRTPAGVP